MLRDVLDAATASMGHPQQFLLLPRQLPQHPPTPAPPPQPPRAHGDQRNRAKIKPQNLP